MMNNKPIDKRHFNAGRPRDFSFGENIDIAVEEIASAESSTFEEEREVHLKAAMNALRRTYKHHVSDRKKKALKRELIQ